MPSRVLLNHTEAWLSRDGSGLEWIHPSLKNRLQAWGERPRSGVRAGDMSRGASSATTGRGRACMKNGCSVYSPFNDHPYHPQIPVGCDCLNGRRTDGFV
jgi:hypothetical protein